MNREIEFIFQIIDGNNGHRSGYMLTTGNEVTDRLIESGIYDRDTEETPFYILIASCSKELGEQEFEFFSRFPMMRIVSFVNFLNDNEVTINE